MKSVALKKLWWILPIVFSVLLSARIIWNEPDFVNYFFLACIASLAAYLLLFKKEMFFGLCVFFVPISVNSTFVPGASMAAPSELMVFILALIAVGVGLVRPTYSRKIIFHPLAILLILDLSWMLIASFYSEMHLYSIKRVFARFLFLLVFYLFTAQWMVKKENLLKFLLLYVLGLIVPIVLTEYHHSFYSFNPRVVFELCKPFYSDHTIYGASIAFVLPFLLIFAKNAKMFGFSKSTNISLWILFVVFVLAEVLAFSRAAWLSLVFSFGIYVFLKLKMRFWHFMILAITVVVLFIRFQEPLYEMATENENVSNNGEIGEHIMSVSNLNTDASNLERINRWKCAIRMFEDRPFTGYGPGTYQFIYGPYQSIYEMTYISTIDGDRGNAHSEPLTYLSETGLPGFISYLVWMLATIGIGMRAYYRAKDTFLKNMILAALLGLMTFFFHGLVNSFIDQIKLASLVFGSIAIIVVADIATKHKPLMDEAKEGH